MPLATPALTPAPIYSLAIYAGNINGYLMMGSTNPLSADGNNVQGDSGA